MTPKEQAIHGRDFYVTEIYRLTGRGYQYKQAKEIAIDKINKQIELNQNDKYLVKVKQELEKL
jgi:hypothetical protein